MVAKKAKSIEEITREIIEFGKERGWYNQKPNHLISSLLIELGELAEHYQWKDSFEKWSQKKKKEVGFEFVDIIFYLFALAYHSGIDIEKYFNEKVPKLAKKFPPKLTEREYKKVRENYRKTGKNKLYE